MRVPDSFFQARSMTALRKSRAAYLDAQEQALTGRRVSKPSEDPLAIGRARSFQDRKRRADNHERAGGFATSRLQVMDSAVGELENLMARAREIGIQALNDTLNASDRADLAGEVDELVAHMRALADTREGDKYIFSGLSSDVAPLDGTGAYQGSAEVQEIEVAPGVRVPLGITAADVFANPSANAYSALEGLATALRANDKAAMNTQTGEVINAGNLVSDMRAQIGAHQTSVDIAANVVSNNSLIAIENFEREVSADAFEAFSALSQAQSALTAAVEIAAQLPLPGLVGR
ncbi:MAG: hypothetical protein OXR73_05545 [Myxococcales bacterium]|nr:hypothetical protein [Myxococcales bacterium]